MKCHPGTRSGVPVQNKLARHLGCFVLWQLINHPRIFEDDTIISENSRRSPKTSEDVRSLPKAKLSSPSLRTRINVSSLPVLFTSKIRDREEVIVI